jgi:hypothetical protein
MKINLSQEQFTRVRLFEGLVALTRHFIDNDNIPGDDVAVRLQRMNILRELFMRYSQALGLDHQNVSTAAQLTTWIGRVPTNTPFGVATNIDSAPNTNDNAAAIGATREEDAGTGNTGTGYNGPDDNGAGQNPIDPNGIDPNAIYPNATDPNGQTAATGTTPGAPSNFQPGDYRGTGPDGLPRYYCKHECRTGTRPDGAKCAHVCCINGSKTKPK